MLICTSCSKKLDEDCIFCNACGAKVQSHTSKITTNIENDFNKNYLNFILLGGLFLIILVIGIMISPYFFTVANFMNVFKQFSMYAAIAFAVTLSTRAKGPDLSIGSVMALSSVIIAQISLSSGSWVMGLMLAIIICGIIGTVNGILTVILKIPSIIVTIITSVVIRGVCYILTQGEIIQGDFPRFTEMWFAYLPLGAIIVLIISFAIAFLITNKSKLGIPMYKRNNEGEYQITYITAYIASSVIAAIVGLYMLSRLSAAHPNIGAEYEIYILFVFACVSSSRVLDNKKLPVIYAMVPALVWSNLNSSLNFLGLSTFLQMAVNGVITLIFISITYKIRYDGSTGFILKSH